MTSGNIVGEDAPERRLSDEKFTASSVSGMTCEELNLTPFKKKLAVCGIAKDPTDETCFDAAPQEEAAAVCDSIGARLCSADETADDAVKGTGCGLDRDMIWTNDKCAENSFLVAAGSSSIKTAPACMNADEPAPFRCCADSAPASKNTAALDTATVGVDFSKIFGISQVGKKQECQKKADATKAAKLCQASGARLCSVSELNANVAKQTGCGLDNIMVWTGEKCGSNSFLATTGAFTGVEAVCTPANDAMAVRCCSETAAAATEQEPEATKKPSTIVGFSKVGKKAKCFSEKDGKEVSPNKAAKVCKASGARLCSVSELESNVAKGTGCALDKTMVWTSETCGVDSFLVTTGANTGAAAECRSDTEDASVRCCMDVEDSDSDTQRLGASFMVVQAAAASATTDTTTAATSSSANAAVFGAVGAAVVAILALAVVAVRSRRTAATLKFDNGEISAV